MISAKITPFDFDACWDPEGVDIGLVQKRLPELFQTYETRSERFNGDVFLCTEPVTTGYSYDTPALNFFQKNRRQNKAVGVLLLDPRELLQEALSKTSDSG